MADLSDKARSVLDLHNRLQKIGWVRKDLTIDKPNNFVGFMFHHPEHEQFGIKAGLCDDFGAIRIELADVTVGEWAELDNPAWVDDCIRNIAASEAEIEVFLKEAGVDSIDELPFEPDKEDIDDELDELL